MADWELQRVEPGETWLAGQGDITAGDDVNENNLIVYAGQLGTATTWTLENES